MGWFSKDKDKEKPKKIEGKDMGGQTGVAARALEGRKSRLDALENEAVSGGPSGRDKEASEGSYRLTTDDKKFK